MKRDDIIFNWSVSASGYRWCSGVARGGPSSGRVDDFLTWPTPEDWRIGGRDTDPLQKRELLLMDFSRLDPDDRGGIQLWAQNFGLLREAEAPDLPEGPGPFPSAHADSLLTWSQEIFRAKTASDLLDVVYGEREPSGVVRWKGEPEFRGESGFEYRASNCGRWLSVPALPQGVRLHPERLKVAARLAIWNVVQEALQGNVDVQPVLDQELEDARLAFKPKDLLAAMWLQFAISRHEKKPVRKCPICGRWTEAPVAGPVRATQKRYCKNPSCRVTASERRKKLAQELAAQGHEIGEIAAQVNSLGLGLSKENTIARWVREADGA